ncbi:MAG: hypothetical protein ABH871_09185, partial [Pseudomonadota bacterium]
NEACADEPLSKIVARRSSPSQIRTLQTAERSESIGISTTLNRTLLSCALFLQKSISCEISTGYAVLWILPEFSPIFNSHIYRNLWLLFT